MAGGGRMRHGALRAGRMEEHNRNHSRMCHHNSGGGGLLNNGRRPHRRLAQVRNSSWERYLFSNNILLPPFKILWNIPVECGIMHQVLVT